MAVLSSMKANYSKSCLTPSINNVIIRKLKLLQGWILYKVLNNLIKAVYLPILSITVKQHWLNASAAYFKQSLLKPFGLVNSGPGYFLLIQYFPGKRINRRYYTQYYSAPGYKTISFKILMHFKGIICIDFYANGRF
jgi:hypothetical protein